MAASLILPFVEVSYVALVDPVNSAKDLAEFRRLL